jgi:hypothetical protein
VSETVFPNAIEWGNQPRTLTWQPIDCEHVLACKRVPYEKVRPLIERCGKGKWLEQIQDRAKFDCCKDPANLDIAAFFTKESVKETGIPDLYMFYCRVCAAADPSEQRGGGHAKFCVGGNHPLAKHHTPQERPELFDRRPFWEIR